MAEGSRPNGAKDTQILGERTTYLLVQGSSPDPRSWLKGRPRCAALDAMHIAHLGIMTAAPPFEVTRTNQSGTFFLSCFGGSGLILVDGSWRRIGEGEACLLPPFVMNSLRCDREEPWKFSWVRYLESREANPLISAHSPVSSQMNPMPLMHAIEGFHSEVVTDHHLGNLQLWLDLIQHSVGRFAQPYQTDSRLWRVWSAVERRPGQPWTLAELADIAAMSEEHLRRLCKKELGRTPMQQVTFLRMQAASHLLTTTREKVATIARAVGYRNPFTFSTSFKKWVGWSPSEHR